MPRILVLLVVSLAWPHMAFAQADASSTAAAAAGLAPPSSPPAAATPAASPASSAVAAGVGLTQGAAKPEVTRHPRKPCKPARGRKTC